MIGEMQHVVGSDVARPSVGLRFCDNVIRSAIARNADPYEFGSKGRPHVLYQ